MACLTPLDNIWALSQQNTVIVVHVLGFFSLGRMIRMLFAITTTTTTTNTENRPVINRSIIIHFWVAFGFFKLSSLLSFVWVVMYMYFNKGLSLSYKICSIDSNHNNIGCPVVENENHTQIIIQSVAKALALLTC